MGDIMEKEIQFLVVEDDNDINKLLCLQYTLHQGDHIGKEVTECSRQKM